MFKLKIQKKKFLRKMRIRHPFKSNISFDVQNFFLDSDLGSTKPLLVDGLQFNQQGDLLEGQLVNPDTPALNEYLRDTMFGEYGIIAGGNLSGLLEIYAIQHNMFKHAAVNQGKPPQEWNFNKLGVTDKFLQTFRKFIPNGKEYDINVRSLGENNDEFSLLNIVKAIQNDYKKYSIYYSYNQKDYENTVAEPINKARNGNIDNLERYLRNNNLPRFAKYLAENRSFEPRSHKMESLAGTSLRTQQAGQDYRDNRREMESLAGTSLRTQQSGIAQRLRGKQGHISQHIYAEGKRPAPLRPLYNEDSPNPEEFVTGSLVGKSIGIQHLDQLHTEAMLNLNSLYQSLYDLEQLNLSVEGKSVRIQQLGQWYRDTEQYIDQSVGSNE